jgi:hypothetical protein
MCLKVKGARVPVSQTLRLTPPTPDESVLRFVEGELRATGRLHGFSALAFVHTLRRRGVTAAERAGLRLALAMYGEKVDPSAHALFREA